MAFMDIAIDTIPNISIITQIELLCWSTDKATMQSVKEFIADFVILRVGPDVVAHRLAIRNSKKIKNP